MFAFLCLSAFVCHDVQGCVSVFMFKVACVCLRSTQCSRVVNGVFTGACVCAC